MITKTELLVRVRDLRIAGFKILSQRDRMLDEREVGQYEYPAWVRGLDRQAGDLFTEATRLERLAQGPAWKRWLA